MPAGHPPSVNVSTREAQNSYKTHSVTILISLIKEILRLYVYMNHWSIVINQKNNMNLRSAKFEKTDHIL